MYQVHIWSKTTYRTVKSTFLVGRISVPPYAATCWSLVPELNLVDGASKLQLQPFGTLPAHLRSTLISRRQFRDGLKSHLFTGAYFWSSENICFKSVIYLLTCLLTYLLSMSPTCLASEHSAPPAPTICWCRRSHCHLSAAELFWSLNVIHWTICQTLLLIHAQSLHSFRHHLKTYLFQRSFPAIIVTPAWT